jgi:CheY-like chemotaxis protein
MVLIVEDDPDMQILQRIALENGGYDVTLANNGLQALQSLGSGAPPNIILLDLMMPVMDGLTFLAKRRTSQTLRDIPVVCASAGGPELLARARALGAAACVAKSSDFEGLCDLVGRYCTEPH